MFTIIYRSLLAAIAGYFIGKWGSKLPLILDEIRFRRLKKRADKASKPLMPKVKD